MTKYIIKIPEPCNEKWEKMTPTQNGRFCKVCSKEIFDFTELTNRQLVEKLENNENVCAKYLDTQLNVDLFSNKNNRLSNAGLVISLTSIIAVSQPAIGLNNQIETQIESRIYDEIKTTENLNPNPPDSLIVHGLIMSESEPVPFVNIVQKGTENGTNSDFDGKFELIIYPKYENEKITLQFSFVGMKTKEIEINKDTKNLDIEMETENVLMGEVVVIESRRNFFQRIGDLFRKKEK